MKNTIKILALLTLAFPLGSVVAVAQSGGLSGKYEGSVKGPDEKVTLDIKSEGGKITGRLTRGATTADVTEGSIKEGILSLTFGKDVALTAKVDDDKLAGDLMTGAHKRAIELTKVATAAAAAPADAAVPAAAAGSAVPAAAAGSAVPFNPDGHWEAVADANGQPFPFLLTLKVDGENVTGSSSSQLGDSTIKTGSWKSGKLALEMEGGNGVITLNATVVEGKLSGEFDYAGQLQGKWVAVKKN